MIIQENEFLKTYNDMNKLWEDVPHTNLSTTVDMSTLEVDRLTEVDWAKIKEASMNLCDHFHADVTTWPYQFQLQYNAYQAECLALELLADPNTVNEINNLLDKYNEPRRIQGTYQLNPNPCAHNLLGISSQPVGLSTAEDNTATVVDIIPADSVDNEDTRITRIEVKCIAEKAQPKGYHKCQIVLVFNIDADSCTVYYFTTRRQLKYTYTIDTVGIRHRCISINPKLDPTARDATEITCSRWDT